MARACGDIKLHQLENVIIQDMNSDKADAKLKYEAEIQVINFLDFYEEICEISAIMTMGIEYMLKKTLGFLHV
jgi:hypothetical protein